MICTSLGDRREISGKMFLTVWLLSRMMKAWHFSHKSSQSAKTQLPLKIETWLTQLDALEERDEYKVGEHFQSVTDHYCRKPFPKWERILEYVKTRIRTSSGFRARHAGVSHKGVIRRH